MAGGNEISLQASEAFLFLVPALSRPLRRLFVSSYNFYNILPNL